MLCSSVQASSWPLVIISGQKLLLLCLLQYLEHNTRAPAPVAIKKIFDAFVFGFDTNTHTTPFDPSCITVFLASAD